MAGEGEKLIDSFVRARKMAVKKILDEVEDEFLVEGEAAISIFKQHSLMGEKLREGWIQILYRGFLREFIVEFIKRFNFNEVDELSNLILLVLDEDKAKIEELVKCLRGLIYE